MKYMGSKRAMLLNGLGTLLEHEIVGATRFVDLFTGSAVVANHVAKTFDVPVIASDLQGYSVILAGAVVQRRRQLNWRTIWNKWYRRARFASKNMIMYQAFRGTSQNVRYKNIGGGAANSALYR